MTADGIVRIGVLGAARITDKALITPSREVQSATIAAVAARDQARADTFALRHGIPAAYGSYEQLLDDPGIDAVYIPLPNGLHAEWTLRAIAAGKHVLCEKPFASNAGEAARVSDAAGKSGLVVMEAMHYRYHPLVQQLSTLIGRGAIGTPRHVQCWTSWPVTDPGDIRYAFPLAGGALMDGGCYAIDCLRLIGLADPTVTGALADPVAEDGRVDRGIAARLASSSDGNGGDGLTGWFESVFLPNGEFRADVHVRGTEGHLRLRNFINAQEGELTVTSVQDGIETVSVYSCADPAFGPEAALPTFTWQLRAFTAAVSRGEEFPTTTASAVTTMRVIDDVYRAAGLPVRG